MGSIKRRWEILLEAGAIDAFRELLQEVDGDDPATLELNHSLQASSFTIDSRHWVFANVTEEFKILARLRFNIQELNAFGTEIRLTN